MTVTYTNDSIFDLDVEAIVNPVNCVGVSGAGLAKQFALRYRDNDRLYREACAAEIIKPGVGLITETPGAAPRYIINFPTKRHWLNDSRIEDIRLGLRNLHRQLLIRKIQSVAIPPLGAGLGGLQWHDVRRLLDKEFGTETQIAVTACNPRAYR